MRVTDASLAPPKPRWRGRLHQAAFFVALPFVVALVALASGVEARTAVAVYGIGLLGVFGTSGLYHRRTRGPRALRWMQRLDHAMIYVLIAGTYTPVSLLAMNGTWSYVLLALVWSGAIFGVVIKLSGWRAAPVLGAVLYIALGWAAVLAGPSLIHGLPLAALILLAAGGVLYTSGALVLRLRKPNPTPAVFGYHEVWHSMTLGASACHYIAILLLVLTVS